MEEKTPKKDAAILLEELRSEPGRPRLRWNRGTDKTPIIEVVEWEEIQRSTIRELREVQERWNRQTRGGNCFFRFNDPRLDLHGFPTFNKTFSGWESGLGWIAGQPNHGKTIAISNLIHGLLKWNEDIVILAFILDDDVALTVRNMVAIETHLRYSDLQQLKLHPNEEIGALAQRTANQLIDRHWVSARLHTFQGVKTFRTVSGQDMRYTVASANSIADIIKYWREAYPPESHKMFVFVDAFNDIDYSDIGGVASDLGKEEKCINLLDRTSIHAQAPILMSAHLRKDSPHRIKRNDHLKGSGKIGYASKITISVHNDYKARREATEVVWYPSERPHLIPPHESQDQWERKRPLLEIYNLKSKVSDEEGPMYYRMLPERCVIDSPVSMNDYLGLRNLVEGEVE